MSKGLLIIFSGPSGVGKDTLLERLRQLNPNMKVSLSLTTRQPRENEIDGVNYRFVTREYFERMIAENRMLEYAQYNSNYYGTPRDTVDSWLEQGKDVFLKIEVQGAQKIRELYPEAIGIFIKAPSLDELSRRLDCRGTDSAGAIANRIEIAKREIIRSGEYDYTVVNDDLDEAVKEIINIIKENKAR